MKYATPIILVIVIALGIVTYMRKETARQYSLADNASEEVQLLPGFPDTDLSAAIIDTDLILSGGPGKDGIPAISDPKFTSVESAVVDDEVLGILVDFNSEKRFYPYNILVWHEIVNDQIGDKKFAVTFCPLCGSAIVFDRMAGGVEYEFGVSGYLFESNLLMYDRTTESLWSQARGEAVVGSLIGTELEVLPMQLLTFSELRENHPDAQVLSRDTGYFRRYDFYPYGDYEDREDTIFPVSVQDNRFPAKKIMYVVPWGEKSLAIPQDILTTDLEAKVEGSLVQVKVDRGEVSVVVGDESFPGYYEMWFSWATHHQGDGIVWPLDESN